MTAIFSQVCSDNCKSMFNAALSNRKKRRAIISNIGLFNNPWPIPTTAVPRWGWGGWLGKRDWTDGSKSRLWSQSTRVWILVPSN